MADSSDPEIVVTHTDSGEVNVTFGGVTYLNCVMTHLSQQVSPGAINPRMLEALDTLREIPL